MCFTDIKHNIDTLFIRIVSISVILLLVFALTPSAQSALRKPSLTIGTTQTINVYPSVVSKSQWMGYEKVLSPDLNNDSLYHEFSKANAAYILKESTPTDQLVRPITSDNSPDVPVDTSASTSVLDTSSLATTSEVVSVGSSTPLVVEPVLETVSAPVVPDSIEKNPVVEEISVPLVPDVIEEVPVVEEVSVPVVLKKATESMFTFFSTVTRLFPFAQLASTTPVAQTDSPVAPNEPPPSSVSLETISSVVATSTIEVSNDELIVPVVVDPIIVSEAATTSGTLSDTVSTSTDTTTVEVSNQSTSEIIATHTLSLTDFSTVPLERGQFVKNMQLRASLAGLYNVLASSTIPELHFILHTGATTQTLGTVLLDGEVSNAINGGYFLFGFPLFDSLSDLTDVSIDIVFEGDTGNLEGVFLDAVWLEIETETITRDDLYARSEGLAFGQLKNPKNHDFISLKRDFSRFESPVFNMRYVSQRNKTVQAVRGFLGQNKIKIEKTDVKHHGAGLLGIVPDVTVTKDGLVSISIPPEQQQKMKPGTYTIEITTNEGGVIVTDSFDFQWGILSINSDKTHYIINNVAEISMGALTPNGNTLCEADLRLYVIDPRGNIAQTSVSQSGKCEGNNVIDVPDYTSAVPLDQKGMYELYLERLDENGEVIGHTNTTLYSDLAQPLSIKRVGPTRIFPPSPYPMTLSVYSDDGFSGTLTERVPNTFTISNTSARITEVGNEYELVWDIDLLAGTNKSVSYVFDAPDLSPYLYELGPAFLDGTSSKKKQVRGIATSTETTNPATTTVDSSVTPQKEKTTTQGNQNAPTGTYAFEEHRKWQIASDATGNMILFWDDGASIPAGWSCLSCGSGTFFQKFAVGSSTYNTTGGTTSHTPTANGSVLASALATIESGSGGISTVSHSHTYTPTIAGATNLPLYRQLRVIQYTTSAGEPASIPTGAIGVFDATVPTGWTQYAAQDGYYIRGEDVPGTTGGSNTHTHALTGTTGGSTGGSARVRGGGTQASGATDPHTHTVSSATPSVNNEPTYIEVILGKIDSAGTAPNGLISMWTDEVPSGWVDVSSTGADPLNNKYLKAATTYGSTGGGNTHTHADVTGILSSVPSATTNGRAGASGASGVHTHSVSVTGFSTDSNIPPYVSVIYGKRQGTDPVYEQLSYQWYVNENVQTPTDPWPVGASDLVENEPITATTTVLAAGDEIRLRMNVELSNATSTAGSFFKLQYVAASVCSAAGLWSDVGDTSSTTVWRGFANPGVTDGGTLSSTVLASSTIKETYQENGIATSSPNQIPTSEVGEWDFVLEQNAAVAGTNYCFRMVESDGTAFATYTNYPTLITNLAPITPTLTTLFDNEKASSTDQFFTFVTSDPEGEDVHYQIQIDDDFAFGSTLEDRNTISNSTQFENQVLISDKAPFNSGALIKFDSSATFVNGTTYWWRVRAKDPDGSNEWGDWATPRSFTIDTSLIASAWFQTTQEQFDTNTLDGVVTATGAANLIVASTTGTMTSSAIDFDAGIAGTAWDSFIFNDSGTTVTYTIQYYTDGAVWTDIPDTDLVGNSVGFGTSPVSLLNLDTATYNDIRIVANYATGGSPSVLDWTIEWGYRVATPVITKLFSNEKTGTTTPLFEFSTSDPQSDSLTYQISWSTDNTFIASTTRTSDLHSGFTNIDAGADLDPFNSEDTIQFRIQGADALLNNTTYWYKVRAKDTTGDNAYSFWTEPQSFTVDTTVTISTWFQTTQEQFATDILSGTFALPSDAVAVATTATEALLVYGEGTGYVPKYRQWNGTAWGTEGSMLSIDSPLKWAKLKAGTTREEYVAVTVGTDADVNAQIFSTGEWNDLEEVTTSMGDINSLGFDVTYETLSGDAMVAYCDGDADPSYYIWNGTSWTSGGTINLASTNNCDWLQLASDPVSNEIIVLARDNVGSAVGSYEAQVWNGSSWGNSMTFGRIDEEQHAGMALAYEESGGQALVLSADWKSANFNWNSWNGTTWGTAATEAIGNDFEWGTLVPDVGTDELALCYQDEDTNIGMIRWTGSAWAGQTELLATAGKSKTNPGFSCVFENEGARDNYIMTAYTDTTVTNSSFWNNTTWSTAAQINTMGDTITSQLERTGVGDILGIFFDETNDSLLSSNWNGTSWSTTTTLENDASVDTTPFGRPFSIGIRNSGREGTTIVSPGINFTDGVGPYWQEMSWVDTTPGTSDILYSVQYNDGASWALIPDIDLPGNAAGTTSSPIDLSSLDKITYNLIRPYATLSCDGSGNCPTISDWTVTWAEGLTVSGTAQAYDQSTNVTSGTVAVAVNGILQSGKTGSIVAGAWSISNVTVFPGDIVTVFITGATDDVEATGVTMYDGTGNITGFQLYERHVSLGSDDATSTALTNADIGLYDVTNTEDVFFAVTGNVLTACGDTGCFDAEIFVNASTTYNPGGNVHTHDIEINGTLISTSTLYVSGSWDNNATTTVTNGSVVMVATSTTESIDTTGAGVSTFGNLTFGTTTGAATWTLANTLDVNGNLTVSRGTLARNITAINVAGSLVNQANGFWSGIGTTTFDGATGANWGDANVTLQNIGNVVVNGSGKIVTLTGNVAANSIAIGADDTLDASVGSYDITTYGAFINNNTFVARNGTVLFAATTTGQIITAGSDAFYDIQFTGGGGSWSFTEATLTVDNDYTIATGTVTMTTATTTVGGSFSSAGGLFAHNNSVIEFDGTTPETITASGTVFTNAFYDLTFSGSGSWTMLDTSATTSNDIRITGGTVVTPPTELAIGGSLLTTNGTITASAGTVKMYSGVAESITLNGSSLFNLLIDGVGTFTMTETNAGALGDLTVQAGTIVLPTGTFSLGGSLVNNATINPQTGTVLFNSADTGETVDLGTSSLYNMDFASASGGWTIVANATSTADTTLTSGLFTLSSGATLSVGATFSSLTGGASTTWTGAILSLETGAYQINTKDNVGDVYDTLRIGATADISMWNSQATVVDMISGGSVYSQDHATTDGSLSIYGEYIRTTGAEYWSYATDFDGTDLSGGNERLADVQFASGATASMSGVLFEMLGDASASTTVANQGAGTYIVSVSGGTTTAQYYDMADLGVSGLSLLASTTVTTLNDGGFIVGADGGTAVTVSSTTVVANPATQIFRVSFATTTAIAATNVTQTDGTPASYWWFRDSSGNLDGEAKDNDTGDPGSVRWDDSSLVLTIAGTVYTDAGVTPLTGGTCDGLTNSVRVVVEGGSIYDGTCSAADGSYSIGGVVAIGDPTVTVFLNDASGGEYATLVTKTPTADVLDADLYVNRVIVRHEDVSAMTIADMAVYDSSDDTDVRYTATTSTGVTLDTFAQTELYVWATTTFTPGGTVTLQADGSANIYDGSLYIANGATFTGAGTTTYTVGGIFTQGTGAIFIPASSTVLMNATTSGKAITATEGESLGFHQLTFSGAGGAWNLNADITSTADVYVETGTVTGTGDITLLTGSFYGNGLVSMGGGTTTVETSNTLGGAQGWTFYDLTLGNGSVTGTTTPANVATTTVANIFTIETGHFYDTGASGLELSGSGTVFVENGTFLEDTGTVRYSGTAATNIIATNYYNLDINASVGTPTYTATGIGISVANNLLVGGEAATILNFDTNDTVLNIDGDLTIQSNGTFIASDSSVFTVAGSYSNNGIYTASGGTITLDGTGTQTVSAGSSDFATVHINGTGSYTLAEHATATIAFTLSNTSAFTLASGQTLGVGGTFTNTVGGSATTWDNTTLSLYGGGNYLVNPATTTERYDTVLVGLNTDIRMWNSIATTTSTLTGSSLYSMDHAGIDGDLYIFGSYEKNTGTDYWSYATDFDGTDLSGGSERKVDVYIQGSDSVLYNNGGTLLIAGNATASTTIQNQGSGVYAFTLGNAAVTTMSYYAFEDIDSDGLTFTGAPDVTNISNGSFLIANNADSGITVGGTAINANPALTFTNNIFATTSGVTTAVNITATGTSVSSWRFTNHLGDVAGEDFDIDPDGDPGYIVWDDSAASITVSGKVYSDEGTTVSAICDGATSNVHLRVAGLTDYLSTCAAGTGLYSMSAVTYSPGDSLIVYIDGEAVYAATVSEDPVSNINNMDLYEDRVIVRHEGTDSLSIADMADWDSSNDIDIPFTAVTGTPDSLTLPADTKLIVWNDKEFEPGGNVTLSGGGAGAPQDGTLQMFSDALWTANGTEAYSIGGSMILDTGAVFVAANSSTTFTTVAASRTIDVNNSAFYDITFTGSGSWSITDSLFTAHDVTITAGALTLPTGTTTISGAFDNISGAFTNNGSVMVFNAATAGNTVAGGGSDFAEMQFTGSGSWSMTDVHATSTDSVTIQDGTLTLPSGIFVVGGDFNNEAGTIIHNTSEIKLTNNSTSSLYANGSDLGGVEFAGTGPFTMVDGGLTLTENLTISAGSVTFASGTLSIGGSFDASGGTFENATGTILFNSADAGESIDSGVSDFYNVVFGSASGGWTITSNATTTNNFTLTTANDFTLASGQILTVGNVFTNAVGGPATTWSGSELVLNGGTLYAMNSKTAGGDEYDTLRIAENTDISMWNSKATTTTVVASGSLYSQDHAASDGSLYIYGDYHIGTTTEYWNYATDFDGTDLTGGSERAVTVAIESGATTTVDGGTLNIVGASGNETTITNQGSGTYGFAVTGGVYNAVYYAYRNLDSSGLNLSGTPTILSLTEGDFELAVDTGTLINLSSTTLNANASLIITGNRFATTTAITGKNVTLTGSTANAWTFIGHTGNLDGENYDVDGGSACGSVRWDDSSCLLTQQVHYRWRNDDGGIGVPADEWYDTDWNKRQRVRLENSDANTYTNAVIKLEVTHDTDMQADFDDLRFTDSSGTTSLKYWIERYTASTDADVWVQVPTLPANDTATIFMYYNNVVATSTSSSTETFVVADDFEDGNFTEYSGDTGLFVVDGSYAYGGSYGLNNAGNEASKAVDGIYRNDLTVSQGEIIRYMQYINTGNSDEVCTLFGVQSPGSNNNNYAVCLEQYLGDRISIAKNAENTDQSGAVTLLASTSVAYSTGWYEVEIDWKTDDSINVTLSSGGSVVATVSTTDSTYSSGGIGFTYWSNHGGWDNYTSRPRVDTEPVVYFGAEQTDGGATWVANIDTAYNGYTVGDVARLRLLLENSGLQVSNQTYVLEYAEQGVSPSCESVSAASFASVPVQGSCGSSPLCMQTSANVTNGGATTDLLSTANGTFTSGKITESPSNTAGALTIDQDQYTELEYVLTPTVNVSDENLCLRVSNSGTDLDTYLRVAKMTIKFDPSFGAINFNLGADIALVAGTTTTVYATSTVTDLNGYADLQIGSSTMYTTTAGASCTADNNNCYIQSTNSQCSFIDCSGTSCTLSCSADFYFHADATDTDGANEWWVFMEVEDTAGGYDFGTSPAQEVLTLRALDVTNVINYGSLAPSSNSGVTNASTTVENLGNVAIDIDVTGTDLSDGYSSTIPAAEQIFATSTFDYSACVTCTTLATSPISYQVDLAKPTVSNPPITDDVFWGIEIPFGISSNPHTGGVLFTPIGTI